MPGRDNEHKEQPENFAGEVFSSHEEQEIRPAGLFVRVVC